MSKYYFRWMGFVSFLYATISAIAPSHVSAEVPLTRASVESLHNHVELFLQAGDAHPARLTDWLRSGDAIHTTSDARVDLRFNDGSFARIGEQATFHFTQDARTFRLSEGTALFLVPPDQGVSTIQTPNAVTRFQETALVVRYISAQSNNPMTHRLHAAQENGGSGRTVVMVLTDGPEGPVEVSLPDGRKTDLTAGQMAILDSSEIFVFEFDLALFYETSTLVAGLHLDDPYYLGSGEPTDVVRLETLEGLANQRSFEGEYLLDPDFLNSETTSAEVEENWLVPLSGGVTADGDLETKPNIPITVPLAGKVSPVAAVEDPNDFAPENITENAATASSDNLPPLVNNPPASAITDSADPTSAVTTTVGSDSLDVSSDVNAGLVEEPTGPPEVNPGEITSTESDVTGDPALIPPQAPTDDNESTSVEP